MRKQQEDSCAEKHAEIAAKKTEYYGSIADKFRQAGLVTANPYRHHNIPHRLR